MNNMLEYQDIVAFHPGYYIVEDMEALGFTQAEFAARLGTTEKTMSELLHGKCRISDELAQKLANMLGTSIDVWINLQKEYDKRVLEIQRRKDLDKEKEIIKCIDYSFFVRVAGLPNTRNVVEKLKNLYTFLKVSSLSVLLDKDLLVHFRTGVPNVRDKNIINSRAWVQTAISLARDEDVDDFDAKKLKGHIQEIRAMTLKDPEEFIPRLKEIFKSCGVKFILLPYLKNSGVNGAVYWEKSGSAILAMNDRRNDADTFWFAVFHEIKHVLQEKRSRQFISFNKKTFTEDVSDVLEQEADEFSRNTLIPLSSYQDFILNDDFSEKSIIEFSNELGVHPGIVLGRLQFENYVHYSRFKHLKTQYKIVGV